MFELRDKQTIERLNEKAYHFYLQHRHQGNWIGKLQHSHLFLEAKIFLMDLNRIRNNGVFTCDFCHQEIILHNNSYSNFLVHYIYRDKNPKEIFNPNHNMLVHRECLQDILKLRYEEEVKKKW